MKLPVKLATKLIPLALLLAPVGALVAQSATGDDLDRRDVSIAVRDGAKLYAVVVTPKAPAKPLPIMLVRTPYGVSGNLRAGPMGTAYAELAKDGYLFVFEDARGTGRSEGRFVMNGALHDPVREPKGIDEATDTYDTIDWLEGPSDRNFGPPR